MAIPLSEGFTANPAEAGSGKRLVSAKEAKRERNRRNRPPKSREELEHRLAVHDRFMAISAGIRERHNERDRQAWSTGGKRWANWLDPLNDNVIIRGYRSQLAEKDAKAAGKARKVDTSRPIELTPAEQVAEIAKRRRKIEREREALEADVRALVSAKAAPVVEIAKALGVSRQRVYQLAS